MQTKKKTSTLKLVKRGSKKKTTNMSKRTTAQQSTDHGFGMQMIPEGFTLRIILYLQPDLQRGSVSEVRLVKRKWNGRILKLPKYFPMMKLDAAMTYAASGGIAVHQNFNVGRAYHVLGLRPQLIEWGRSHGQRINWLQEPTELHPNIWHYDVFGSPARKLERELNIV